MNAPISPLHPQVMQAWSAGKQEGYAKASEEFAKFLNERMESLTEIPGIGEVTAAKIQFHFLKEIDK